MACTAVPAPTRSVSPPLPPRPVHPPLPQGHALTPLSHGHAHRPLSLGHAQTPLPLRHVRPRLPPKDVSPALWLPNFAQPIGSFSDSGSDLDPPVVPLPPPPLPPRRDASRRLPISGFEQSGPSDFHFGGTPGPVPTYETVPSFPPPSSAVGGGLPSIDVPSVEGSRAAWLRQLDRLQSLPGTDLDILAEVRAFVVDGVRAVFPGGRPPPRAYANTNSFRDSLKPCLERLRVYRDLGALRYLTGPPPPGGYSYVQPLHAVLKPGKDPRVCVDLSRNFNDYLPDVPFHMASVQSAVDLALQCGGAPHFVKLDISSCFLSFPLHPDDLHYYVCKAGGDYIQFLRMVFGLKSAPRVASLLLDVVSSALADAGVAHVRYLDDFFLVATTAERAWASAHVAAGLILEFGLALSLKKVEGPAQRLEFLGIVVDSLAQSLSISEARQTELQGILASFSGRRRASVRSLHSLLGKLSFAATVLPGARPFLRRIIDRIAGRSSGQSRLGDAFHADVGYWRAHMARWNGRAKWRQPTSAPYVFASDASTSGFAYGLESCPESAVAGLPLSFRPGAVRAGVWSASNGDAARQQESATIQWGEFFCPLAAAVEFAPYLTDSHVVFVIDNESDVYVINRLRTREPRVAGLLRALCDTSLRYNFSFTAVHRAGDDNKLMDWASRPDLHRFTSSPPRWPAACDQGGVGGGGSLARFPPLLVPMSVTCVNSRCLTFDARTSSANWATISGGWSPCVASYTSPGRLAGPTRATKVSSSSSVRSSTWTRC